MVQFAIAPPEAQGSRPEPYAAQLALARLHPHLVPVSPTPGGYVIDISNASGWFELAPGRGLAGYGLARALRILLDLLSGLSALHDTRTADGRAFTHGELVPALVRIDRSGTARLVPLAPWHGSTAGLEPSPERVGHLAPERLLGDAIDPRADVFSGGVLLWEALAGRRLFESDSIETIIMRLMGGRVTLPALPPEISWATPLTEVAMRALTVDPEQRFSSVADFADAIESVAADRVATHAEVVAYFSAREPHARPSIIEQPKPVPTHHSSLSALVAPVSHTAQAQASLPERDSTPPATHGRAGLRAAGVGMLLVVAIGAGIALRSPGRPPATRAPTAAAAGRLAPALATPALPSTAPSPDSSAETGSPDARPAVPALLASAIPASAMPSAPTKHGSKSPKGPKPTLPKVKASVKPSLARTNEAELYGI